MTGSEGISSITVVTTPKGLRDIAQRLEESWRTRLPDQVVEVSLRSLNGITLRFEMSAEKMPDD